ncbi:hypothetical protein XpopCFBP1817_14240 [Xanthomonas populi]|uniref:Uncharacterized protein n=1 Tax=Xanthomonas populi TaxID=53414 RepID=A0A2S7EM31_9XANT|nr:hypothetical protein XpopCFBP1817_14240 [Xanthomonas populi]
MRNQWFDALPQRDRDLFTGSGKRQFGEGDLIWDFNIIVGLLYGWMLRYLAERGCLIRTA